MVINHKLPQPDLFGNYYLEAALKPNGPAIFHRSPQTKGAECPGGYIASTGEEVLFSGTELRVFSEPMEALFAIKARVGKK